MNISIIGLGLMGGSFGLAVRQSHLDHTIAGWDANEENLNTATELGLIDHRCEDLKGAIQRADGIILTVPVDAIERMLPEILALLQPNQWVVDFGSTKHDMVKAVEGLPMRHRYLAAHPITGTEYSGPQAAFSSLYLDKVMILCDKEATDSEVVEVFETLCLSLNMKLKYLSASEHDRHLAYVSHLSHVIAFCLSNTVLRIEEDDKQILDLAGSGFASTVRLAKSSPEMWTPIFLKNKTNLEEGLERYCADLLTFREYLKNADRDGLMKFLDKGRQIKKILD